MALQVTRGSESGASNQLLGVVRKEIELVEGKLSRQLSHYFDQSERLFEGVLEPLKGKVAKLEEKQRGFDYSTTDISGSIKALVTQVETCARREEATEARVARLAQGIDERLRASHSELRREIDERGQRLDNLASRHGQRLSDLEALFKGSVTPSSVVPQGFHGTAPVAIAPDRLSNEKAERALAEVGELRGALHASHQRFAVHDERHQRHEQRHATLAEEIRGQGRQAAREGSGCQVETVGENFEGEVCMQLDVLARRVAHLERSPATGVGGPAASLVPAPKLDPILADQIAMSFAGLTESMRQLEATVLSGQCGGGEIRDDFEDRLAYLEAGSCVVSVSQPLAPLVASMATPAPHLEERLTLVERALDGHQPRADVSVDFAGSWDLERVQHRPDTEQEPGIREQLERMRHAIAENFENIAELGDLIHKGVAPVDPSGNWQHALALAPQPTEQSAAGVQEGNHEMDEALSKVFASADINNDGSVSRIELIKALREKPDVAAFLGLPQDIRQEDGSRDKFEEFFQSIDADNSRTISLDEFRAHFVTSLKPYGTEAALEGCRSMAAEMANMSMVAVQDVTASVGDCQMEIVGLGREIDELRDEVDQIIPLRERLDHVEAIAEGLRLSSARAEAPPPSAAAPPPVFASPPQRVFAVPPPNVFSAPLPTPPIAPNAAASPNDPLMSAGLNLEDLDVRDLLAIRRGDEGAEGGEVERVLERFRSARSGSGSVPNSACSTTPPPAVPGMDLWDSMARAIDLKAVPRNLKARNLDEEAEAEVDCAASAGGHSTAATGPAEGSVGPASANNSDGPVKTPRDDAEEETAQPHTQW